jgi:hypothetical protein
MMRPSERPEHAGRGMCPNFANGPNVRQITNGPGDVLALQGRSGRGQTSGMLRTHRGPNRLNDVPIAIGDGVLRWA